MTKKKVTRVESSETDVKNEKVFVPTEENKKKQQRIELLQRFFGQYQLELKYSQFFS